MDVFTLAIAFSVLVGCLGLESDLNRMVYIPTSSFYGILSRVAHSRNDALTECSKGYCHNVSWIPDRFRPYWRIYVGLHSRRLATAKAKRLFGNDVLFFCWLRELT